MIIKRLNARAILNSRKEKTILVTAKTSTGKFSASAPSGKSKGKFEAKSYKTNLNGDIKTINSTNIKSELNKFNDLKIIEKKLKNKIGANTMFALEAAALKAIAKQQKKQVWQLINNKARKLPYPVGNVIGGGLHSLPPRPDFQEFLVIPQTRKFADNVKLMKQAHKELGKILKTKKKKNDENAWQTNLQNEQVLEIMEKTKTKIGLDIAASAFYKNNKYIYKNPRKTRTKEQQINYISQLIKKFSIFYIEDPLAEGDFAGFAKLNKKAKNSLIVGDDLTVTNLGRIKKAKKMRAINAVIIKPNQNGSLIEVDKIIQFCKKNNIKTIMSHRSGETTENIIADLAFGWQCDFIKTGVLGKERDAKLKRLVGIEKKS